MVKKFQERKNVLSKKTGKIALKAIYDNGFRGLQNLQPRGCKLCNCALRGGYYMFNNEQEKMFNFTKE